MRKLLILLCFAPFFVASCTRSGLSLKNNIPLVREILSDTSAAPYSLISSYKYKSPDGAIVVIGDPDDVQAIGTGLLRCDLFNNIDASASPDGLPDFAGETIYEYLDEAYAPYENRISDGEGEFLKEAAVRHFLSALDTLCMKDEFDNAAFIHKEPAKIVVLASSELSRYGKADIDTLCRIAGGGRVPVVSTSSALNAYVFSRYDSKANMAIVARQGRVFDGLYPNSAFVFAEDSLLTEDALLLTLLERYASDGEPRGKLSCICVDDSAINANSLKDACLMVKSDPQYKFYADLLSDDCSVISSVDAVAMWCYNYLRRTGRFKHKIAYPDAETVTIHQNFVYVRQQH